MFTDLETHRRQKDRFFKLSPDSPIPYEQRESFSALHYYADDSSLRFAVHAEPFAEQEPVYMTTSTGGAQEYVRWGRFQFEVDHQTAELTIYHASWGGFFLPFADATSGGETYGAGRYLDLEQLSDGDFIVDFNLAYNPYCAYSDDYSCPIPPPENRLAVPIRAGELVYAEAH